MNARSAWRSLLLMMTGLWLCLGVTPASAQPLPPKIAWSPCNRDLGFPFECGTVQVPLDYDNQGIAAVSIALVRLPATDPARRIGSLFFNPGGPGGSGVDFILSVGPFLYTDEVRARFDFVGFDPRGIARSTAVRCFGTSRQWGPAIAPFPFPVTPEEETIWQGADLFLDAACDQRGTRLIDHMATADVARDLDRLREAVGDEQLSFVGYSYGSYMGVTYANLFPNNFRALVVDGVLNPVEWATGVAGEESLPFSTRLHSDIGALATLNEFFRLCDAGGPNCAFSPNSANRFSVLAAKLRVAPLVITTPEGITFTFTYADLIANALGAMYSSPSWPSFAQFLAAVEAADPPAVLGTRLFAFWQDLGFITKRGNPQYLNSLEGFPGVACSDSNNPNTYAAWSTAAADSEAHDGYFGRIWTWISSICAEWPGSDGDRYIGPFNTSTANPVLVTNKLFDPATRYEGAVFVASLLPNARLLTVSGWGHTTLFSSHLADQAVALYLLEGTLPDVGTVYNQDFVPFAGSTATVASSANAQMQARVTPTMVPNVVRNNVHLKQN